MSREWKPGDVAAVECSDGKWRQAAFLPGGIAEPQWVFADNARRWVGESAARPLVTIDPEDRGAVERLWRHTGDGGIDDLQYALRQYANPNRPKPDEPQGLGAVVEDEKGCKWTRAGGAFTTSANWLSLGSVHYVAYSDIAAVRVLSPGVDVDQ